MAQRQIDDSDPIAGPIGDREVDRPADRAGVARAALVQDPKRDERDLRGDSPDAARTAAADDAGDVGSVTHRVQAVGLGLREIDGRQHPAGDDVRVRHDAGIDQRHRDAPSRQAEILEH